MGEARDEEVSVLRLRWSPWRHYQMTDDGDGVVGAFGHVSVDVALVDFWGGDYLESDGFGAVVLVPDTDLLRLRQVGRDLPVSEALGRRQSTVSSTPIRRRCPLRPIFGSKVAPQSRGMSISMGSTSVVTVSDRCPLRTFPPSPLACSWWSHGPRRSVSSSSSAVSSARLANSASRPPSPVNSRDCSRA